MRAWRAQSTLAAMRTATHLLAALAAAAALAACAAAPAAAQTPLNYKIRTVSGDKQVTTDAVIGVPALVNPDGGLVPALTVELLPNGTSGLILEILALRPVPVLVDVIVPIPNTRQSVTLGYDARVGGAPLLVHQTASAVGDDLAYDFALVGARKGIAMRASLSGDDDATTASLGFPDAVPLTGRVAATQAGPLQTVQATSAPPVRGVLSAAKSAGETRKTLTADITTMPAQTTLEIERDAQDELQRVGYAASSAVKSVDVTAEDRRGDTLVTQAVAHLRNVPPAATLTRNGSRIDFDAPAATPAWTAEVGLAQKRAVALDSRAAYVKAIDADGARSVAFKLAGVTKAAADTGSPLQFELTHEPKPLHVSVLKDTLSLEGDVPTPPRRLRVTFDKETKSGSIDAFGQPIGDVTLTGHDDNGIGAGATELLLDVDGVPPFLRFGAGNPQPRVATRKFEEEITEEVPGDGGGGGSVPPDVVNPPAPVQPPVVKQFFVEGWSSADATAPKPDAAIGSVLFRLSSETSPKSAHDQALLDDPQASGFLLEDTSARFLAFGRIDALRAARVKTVRDSRTKKAFVAVDSTSGKPARVGFFRQPVFNGAIEATTATLPKLPAGLSLDLVTSVQDITSSRTDLFYRADESVPEGLTFTTNAGKRKLMRAALSPVPKTIDLCVDGFGQCLRPVVDRIKTVDDGSESLGTAITFDASEEVTVDFLDCTEARDPAVLCDEKADAKKAVILNGSLRHFELGEDVDSGLDEEWIWVDTNDHPAAAHAELFKRGTEANVVVDTSRGFRANDRLVGFGIDPAHQEHRAGSVVCAEPFDIDYRVFVLGEIAQTIFCTDRAGATVVP